MKLETNNIIIREFKMGDAPELSGFLQSDYIAKWMPEWFECADEWLGINVGGNPTTSNKYAVIEKVSGNFIGAADYMLHDDDLIEVTIILRPENIEKGYLTESYKLFLEYLRNAYEGRQIEIVSRAENEFEIEAIEKLGLQLTQTKQIGEIKIYNHYMGAKGYPFVTGA